MAVTQGHGNPAWTFDETILALELYHRISGSLPGGKDPDVIELSKYLRSMKIHNLSDRNDRFRNPSGVAFKLKNLNAVKTSTGLQNHSKVDAYVWKLFGDKIDLVRKMAADIRSANKLLEKSEESDDDFEFPEGKTLTKLHKSRERSKSLRKEVLRRRTESNQLSCDICGLEPNFASQELNYSVFEVHHIKPLSELLTQTKTKYKDVALLCACCHRSIHKLISLEKRWFSVSEAKSRLMNS